MQLVIFLGVVGAGTVVEVLIIFWFMAWGDGKRTGRNGGEYNNRYKRKWLALSYEKGYQRGGYLFRNSDSDEDRNNRNRERFGR